MTHYVYDLFDAEGRLIYVGTTTDVPKRIRQHRQLAWWGNQIAAADIVSEHPDHHMAQCAERVRIAEMTPRWNIYGQNFGRQHWTEQNYRDFDEALSHTTGHWFAFRDKIRAEFVERFGTGLMSDAA